MNYRNYLPPIAAIICFSFLPGCALLFSSEKQKVTIQSKTPGATIKYNDDSVGITTVRLKLRKSPIFQNVVLEKDGYKSKSYCFQADKMAGALPLIILDPMFMLGTAWEGTFHKLRRYKRVQEVPALTPCEGRKKDEKYLLVNNVAVDAKGTDISYQYIGGMRRYQKNASGLFSTYKVAKAGKGKSKQGLSIENTIFADELNSSLKKLNFIDTTHTIFPDVSNSMYLNATIKKISFIEIHRKKEIMDHTPTRLLCVDLEIDWDLLDYYKQKVYSSHSRKRSDIFLIKNIFGDEGKKQMSEAIEKVVQDNMEYALIDFRRELTEKNLLTISGSGKDTASIIMLNAPQAGTGKRINEFLKSTVSVKVDDGHGSGVIVSADGYIVTNYHVVAGTKNIEVIFNDGTKAAGEVIRKNEEADLALIKVKKDSLIPLILSHAKDPDIGIDVWAIGTPKSLELGQSVSKGIISGVRKANDITYLQTDVKISPGNSGGALINKDGTVLGIVSAKLIGLGTEGVGFAILTNQVFDKLRLQYK